MSGIIQLLPDSIANQIAAGEVIQRPASIVKELLENSLDAGSNRIEILVKDAGKTLVQVTDNGRGMSDMDARMCFERHATSKIRSAEDLFSIKTMGFRGEALASIASIAHVELKTLEKGQSQGSKIIIKGSELVKQEPVATPEGTQISVKNIFYNVPARRKFLKSDPVEFRHILDEVTRIALANPQVAIQLIHNQQIVFQLQPGNLRQRIVGLLGKKINDQLIPIEEETEWVKFTGFITKPDYYKKTRGEQYFFVNNRYIKSPYLAHAVKSAYHQLIPEDHHPFYALFLELDPAKVDVNVHPTKQEIKFEDERIIYNYLKVSIRHGLGQYAMTPSIDFDQESRMDRFTGGQSSPAFTPGFQKNDNRGDWEKVYGELTKSDQPNVQNQIKLETQWGEIDEKERDKGDARPFQVAGEYLVGKTKSGMIVVNQKAAHERILFEQFMSNINAQQVATQPILFPETLHLDSSKAIILKSLLPLVQKMGLDIQEFGGDSFIVHGLPAIIKEAPSVMEWVDELLEQYTMDYELKLDIQEKTAISLAKTSAVKKGTVLNPEEVEEMIDQLFGCEIPQTSPTGEKCFVMIDAGEIENYFK